MAFLDVDRPTGRPGGQQQVGLTAQEGRDLQDVDGGGHRGTVLRRMDIGQHRQTQGLADLGKDRQRRLQANAAGGAILGAVGFVERRLENEANARGLAQALERRGNLKGMFAAFHLAGAGDQHQRPVIGQCQRPDVDGMDHRCHTRRD